MSMTEYQQPAAACSGLQRQHSLPALLPALLLLLPLTSPCSS
jgi:hypothetical protein